MGTVLKRHYLHKPEKLIVVILFLMLIPQLGFAERILRVGVAGSPPFKVMKAKEFGGISVELWEETAHLAKLGYRYISFPSVRKALRALKSRRIDIAIGSISITSKRATNFDFTQPYYLSHTGILTLRTKTSFWRTIKPFIRTTFLVGVVTLFTVLFIVGNLIWLAERKKNDSFPNSYIQGIGNGMWFAVVTFTTVGYGDITPKSRAGRLIASVWMIIALITASSLTAGIATSFTLFKLRHSNIESAQSLENKRVSVIKGTTGVEFAKRHGAIAVHTENIDNALGLLLKGKVSAHIFDYPVLKYFLKKNPNPDLIVLESKEDMENYGFCLASGNPLFNKINRALLLALEKGELHEILKKWGID